MPGMQSTKKTLLVKITIIGKKIGSFYRTIGQSYEKLRKEIDEIDSDSSFGVTSEGYSAGCIYWIDSDCDQIEIDCEQDWIACFQSNLDARKRVEIFVIASYMVELEDTTVIKALQKAGLKRDFLEDLSLYDEDYTTPLKRNETSFIAHEPTTFANNNNNIYEDFSGPLKTNEASFVAPLLPCKSAEIGEKMLEYSDRVCESMVAARESIERLTESNENDSDSTLSATDIGNILEQIKKEQSQTLRMTRNYSDLTMFN